MSGRFIPRRQTGSLSGSLSGLAMVVEAIVLVLFLAGSLAVLTQLFAAASMRSREGERLAQAISAATTCAERFAADPAGTSGTSTDDGLVVDCEVTPEQTDAGTLYHATITVFSDATEAPLYVLETARYESEGVR